MVIATSEPPHPRPLPRVIRRGLARVSRRLRAAGGFGGLGKSAIILAVAAVLAMAVDVAFLVPQPARFVMWGVWTLTAVVALIAGVIRPLVRRHSWNDLAALAERAEPALGERLTSAVGLLRQRPHGSPELIDALVLDATDRAGQVDLTKGVASRRPWAWLAAGAVAAAFVVLPPVLKPDPYAIIARRFLFPWAEIGRVGRFVVEVAPGDQVMAVGSELSISAVVRPRFGEAVPRQLAWLEWTGSDGVSHRVSMPPGSGDGSGQRSFAVALPRLAGSLDYRAVFGVDESRQHHVTAIERPAVASLRVRIEPPSYTRRLAAPARDPARIEAWEDSRVTLEIEASRPLKDAELVWPAASDPGKSGPGSAKSRIVALATSGDPTRWTATVAAESSGPYSLRLRDEYDLENKPEAPRRVVVRPDAPPILTVTAPDQLKETSPNDILAVAVAARDDVQVVSAEMEYTIARGDASTSPGSGRVAATLAGLETPLAVGEAVLGLRTLGLRPGDEVSYRIGAKDNRPAPRGPNITWSSTHQLRIVEHSESLAVRQANAEREALRVRLDAIQKGAADSRQKGEQLRYQADAVRRGNGNWDESKSRELAGVAASATAVRDQLQVLSREMEAHPTFHPLARSARQLAEVESAAAVAAMESARRAVDPAARQAELEQAGIRLAVVTSKVDELRRKFDELARLDDDDRRHHILAQREDDLASRADQAAKMGDRAALSSLADDQGQVRRELDEELKRSPALRSEVLAAQALEADSLAARARDLAQREREQARATAATGQRSAAIKALAGKQRAIEDDARRLAIRLDEPLAQNSRARVDVDAVARAAEAIDRGDLDQARDRTMEAENSLNFLARDVADVPRDARALARRLTRRQDDLKNETLEAIREVREHPPQTPEGKAALADRLKPLAERQEAIARLTAAIPAPQERQDAAHDAVKKTATARDDLREGRPRDVEGHQSAARDALNRLADSLPDPLERRDRARQKVGEIRARQEELARELERHLRETEPRQDQPRDPVRDAIDLADRVAPLAAREREMGRALAEIDREPRAVAHRDRAARRASQLADALESLRQQAPPRDAKADEPRPLAAWHVLGAFGFDSAPPFPVDKPIDIGKKFTERKGQQAPWRPSAPVDAHGTIDLAALYGRDDKLAAFAVTELSSPAARTARMLIGSDDTLTVWLNGKTVYDFRGQRSHGPATDRIDVSLAEGVNRIVVECGNSGGEWKFSIALTPAPAVLRPSPEFQRLREALPRLEVAARSAIDRLQQELDGRIPADDLAAALADDERDLKSEAQQTPAVDAAARAEAANNQRRIANALSNVDAPDAAPAKAEAIRAALAAAEALEEPSKDGAPRETSQALARAALAATALARQLADGDEPRENEVADHDSRAFDDRALGIAPADHADADALGRRQRHLREELQAILGAGVVQERGLREHSTALARDVADLFDRARDVSPRSHGPAQAAADLLGRAIPEAMDRAATGLGQGRPGDALGAQRQAADLAEQSARNAEDLAAALRADSPAEPTLRARDGFAAALAAARAAGKHLSSAGSAPKSPAEAAQAAAAAAAALRTAAHGLRASYPGAHKPPASGNGAMAAGDSRGAIAGPGTSARAGLEAAVRAQTGRTWGELPGHLRTEILQMSEGRYRDDYARLIELYFREIAADAAPRGTKP